MAGVPEIGFMQNYSTPHLVVLAITVVAIAVGVPAARRPGAERWVGAFGWVMLAASLGWMVWWWLPGHFDVHQSLPFHLSDWLRVITGVALITRSGWAVVLSYYWGLTLNLQAVLTPDLVYFRNPALEFGMYWFLHVVALVAPIVLVWGLGYRPTWRGFAAGYVTTLAWAGVAIAVNAFLGTNYGFVSEPPGVASALDLLGPWPWYLLSVAALLAVVFAAMTWPWTTDRARAASVACPSGLVRRRVARDERAVRRTGVISSRRGDTIEA